MKYAIKLWRICRNQTGCHPCANCCANTNSNRMTYMNGALILITSIGTILNKLVSTYVTHFADASPLIEDTSVTSPVPAASSTLTEVSSSLSWSVDHAEAFFSVLHQPQTDERQSKAFYGPRTLGGIPVTTSGFG